MSATPKSHSALQRVNKAYVLVPPSPVSLSSYRPLRTPVHVAVSSKLKENTPLRSSQLAMSQQVASSPSLKRKLSERDPSSLVFDGSDPKRPKLSTGTPLKQMQIQPLEPGPNACAEFPNGFTYCHQCNKKRDLTEIIRCTSVTKKESTKAKKNKERLCSFKYCKPCLKNRYDGNFDIFMSGADGLNGIAPSFKCPRCNGVCNCPRCRKAQGLDAIGPIKAKPKESQPVLRRNKSLKVEVVIETKRPKFKAKLPKPLPVLKWTQVPTGMTQRQADDRIFIREFVLRFSDLLEPAIAKTYLEELEFISGRMRRQEDEEDAWVSEACIRSMLSGLLGLLCKHVEENTAKIIRAKVKDLRSAGINLNKLWACLASLREDIANSSPPGETRLTFSDPYPPPAPTAAPARQLRNTRQAQNSVNVLHTSQLIPVLHSLIHSVLETAVIREDLDQCVKDSKDFARDAKEATRIENERWEKEKSGMEVGTKDKMQKSENRVKRLVHKEQISNIDNCLKIISRTFVPRFMTLGTDDEGRTYYALSPSVAEREAAFEYLEVASSGKPTKPKKKGRALSVEERQELRDWSWFIAVWGKRPPLSLDEKPLKMDVNPNAEEGKDPEIERWWAFWEPEEIVKVADWISIKSGLDEKLKIPQQEISSSSTSKPSNSAKEKSIIPLSPHLEHIRRLVTELKDYAALLEWRVREDKCVLAGRTEANSSSAQTSQAPSGKGKDKISTGTSSSDN